MIDYQKGRDGVNLELLTEAHVLYAILETLRSQMDAESEDIAILDSVLEKLSDAKALAIWLRDYVRLDLDCHEALWILQTLEARIGQKHESYPEVLPILESIRASLSDSLSGHVAAAT